MNKKPLIIFILICWIIAAIGIAVMLKYDYDPLPEEKQFIVY